VLLDRPGEIVNREELRKHLWPADTFVDYDHTLNTAVNKLREALSDSADNPRFIQTLPHQGYRFIAPVTLVNSAPHHQNRPEHAAPVTETKRTVLLSEARDLPVVPRFTARLLFSLLQVLYLGFYIAWLANLRLMEKYLVGVVGHATWIFVLLLLTASAGIPIRLYLLSAAALGYRGLTHRFLKLFQVLFPLGELWALAPFLIVDWIGIGLALAATAALLFLPFSQRSLLLMGDAEPPTPTES
jgi:cholera toxin transcriptional activator